MSHTSLTPLLQFSQFLAGLGTQEAHDRCSLLRRRVATLVGYLVCAGCSAKSFIGVATWPHHRGTE